SSTAWRYGPVNGAPMPLNESISPIRMGACATDGAATAQAVATTRSAAMPRGLNGASGGSGRDVRDDARLQPAFGVEDVRVHGRASGSAIATRDRIVNREVRADDLRVVRGRELGALRGHLDLERGEGVRHSGVDGIAGGRGQQAVELGVQPAP